MKRIIKSLSLKRGLKGGDNLMTRVTIIRFLSVCLAGIWLFAAVLGLVACSSDLAVNFASDTVDDSTLSQTMNEPNFDRIDIGGTDSVYLDALNFTLSVKNECRTLSTDDTRIIIVANGKTPGDAVHLSEYWQLVRLENDTKTVVGDPVWRDVAIVLNPESDDEIVQEEIPLSFATMTSLPSGYTLEVGSYCVEYYSDSNELLAQLPFNVR